MSHHVVPVQMGDGRLNAEWIADAQVLNGVLYLDVRNKFNTIGSNTIRPPVQRIQVDVTEIFS